MIRTDYTPLAFSRRERANETYRLVLSDADFSLLKNFDNRVTIGPRGINPGNRSPIAETGGRLLDAVDPSQNFVHGQTARLAIQADQRNLDPLEFLRWNRR